MSHDDDTYFRNGISEQWIGSLIIHFFHLLPFLCGLLHYRLFVRIHRHIYTIHANKLRLLLGWRFPSLRANLWCENHCINRSTAWIWGVFIFILPIGDRAVEWALHFRHQLVDGDDLWAMACGIELEPHELASINNCCLGSTLLWTKPFA